MDLFNKIAGPLTPGAFQWILRNFQEHLFYISFCEWLLQLIKPHFTVSWDQLKAAFFVLWKCRGCQIWALREKCPNTEFFLFRIFPHSDWIRRVRIWEKTDQKKLCSISPYSVRMRENTDRKKLRIWILLTQLNRSLGDMPCNEVCCPHKSVPELDLFNNFMQ